MLSRPAAPVQAADPVRVGNGKCCFLATVIDLCSRRMAGWAISDHMRAELVIDALAAAERCRGSLNGAIAHTDYIAQTDRGAQ